ncbi:trypsin-like peptidase domain-containing protein [Rothia nasimurium]|uniref:S1C family serine protease n=1 Tax=Rothia nasimurium TaxID=85336 RepID=UPI003BA028D6
MSQDPWNKTPQQAEDHTVELSAHREPVQPEIAGQEAVNDSPAQGIASETSQDQQTWLGSYPQQPGAQSVADQTVHDQVSFHTSSGSEYQAQPGYQGEAFFQPVSTEGSYQQGPAYFGPAAHPVYQEPASAYGYSADPQVYGAGAYYAEAGKKKHSTGTVLALALLAALVGGGVGGAVMSAAAPGGISSLASVTSGTTIVNNTDSVNEVTAVAAKATPSTVTISATSSTSSGSGSGVIIDGEGHILTNTHVVTLDGATANASIEVQLADGTVRPATVVGTDPTSDLAVIKLENTSGLTLTPASLGDSDALNVGDLTVAIGAPLGLSNTVTTGVVSNLVRTIEVASSAADESTDSGSSTTDPFGSSPFQFEIPGQQSQGTTASSTIAINVIQTDAAVNPGNSGGALINSAGEVIGINVAIASTDSSSTSTSGNIGVGFAIPINYAKRVAQEIIATGSATHGMLGATVTTSPANNDSSQAFGDGALIRELTAGGAAEAAGLQANDVVVAVNGRAITDATELTATVRQAAAGEEVTLTIQRGTSTQDVKVTLGSAE